MFNSIFKIGNIRAALAVLMIPACASVQKVDIPMSANPTSQLEKLDTGISKGYEDQNDVLAADDFARALGYRDEARDAIAHQKEQKAILDKIGYGLAYLQAANAKADPIRPSAEELLSARRRAIMAGARGDSTIGALKELDSKFCSYVPVISSVGIEKVKSLQSAYIDLEGTAIREAQLGTAISLVQGAKKEGAEDWAPQTLRRAEIALHAAESAISANRSDPTQFDHAVSKARNWASFLHGVLEATDRGKVDETTATKLVRQDRQIDSLEAEVKTSNDTVAAQSANLKQKTEELNSAGNTISAQQALDESRGRFTDEEAEVFQQGNRLVIRLKNMSFPSGSANLPADSLSLLAKVNDVAQRLNPKEIAVEGHTDSTGAAELNERLSKERAQAVSKYFASNGIDSDKITVSGYGDSHPIASNKDEAGRAMNRRVDIVITPGSTTQSSSGVVPKESANN